jgi:hypothetical protein
MYQSGFGRADTKTRRQTSGPVEIRMEEILPPRIRGFYRASETKLVLSNYDLNRRQSHQQIDRLPFRMRIMDAVQLRSSSLQKVPRL